MAEVSRRWFWDLEQPVYKHGLPFSEVLAPAIDEQFDRVKRGFASMIVIDGGVGQGKTTLGTLIGEYGTRSRIVFKDQLGMGGQSFVKNLKVCFVKGYAVVLYDEGGDFSGRGALTKLNLLLNRVFETYRAFKIVVIIILPLFKVLDQSIFDKQIPRMVVNCHERDERDGSFRVYDLEGAFWLRFHMNDKRVFAPKAYQKVTPNFRGHFLNLSPARAAELDKFSTKGKLEIVDLGEIKGEGLLTFEEMASKLGRSVIWVKKRVGEFHASPTKKHKNRNYYSAAVFERLESYIK